jgi:hypothetical protein
MQLRQLLQQRLHLLQIARVKAFSEPPANRSEKIAGLVPFVLIAQPRARGGRVRYCSDSDRIAALRQLSVWASNGLMRRSKKAQSLDNLVGSHKQGWRHRKPKRLRSFEIDDHQILCWQLDGEF